MKRYAGQVWFLPPEFEEGGDGKRRPHLLLNTCDDENNGVFSYASTASTEARFGAANVFVDPADSPDPQTGLTKPTYIYPSRLVAVSPEDFGTLAGLLTCHMPLVRARLGVALGLGTGTTAGTGAAASSWRGRVVLLSARAGEALGYRYGIVVTEANYSRARRYQIIVPLDELSCFEPSMDDLIRTNHPWIGAIDPRMNAVVIGVTDVQSVFHPVDIDRWTGAVIDDETLNEVEAALEELFKL